MKVWKLLVAALMLFSSSAFAGKFGLGFILGEPVALSGKYSVDTDVAYDLQLSFSNHDYIVVYGDRLFQFPNLIPKSNDFFERLNPYVGVGPLLVFENKADHAEGQYFEKRGDKLAVGARIPFGIEWVWERVPLGIGLELTPGIVVLPATTGVLMGGLTFRFYF